MNPLKHRLMGSIDSKRFKHGGRFPERDSCRMEPHRKPLRALTVFSSSQHSSGEGSNATVSGSWGMQINRFHELLALYYTLPVRENANYRFISSLVGV